MAIVIDEDVGGLDVAVNDTFGMGSTESVGNFAGKHEKRFQREGLSRNAMLEGQAFEKLHGNEDVIAMLADFINGADIGMIERGCGARLTTEAFKRVRISGDVSGEKFQGYKTAELGILSLVNDTHTAAPELVEDAIVGDDLANHGMGRMLRLEVHGVNAREVARLL